MHILPQLSSFPVPSSPPLGVLLHGRFCRKGTFGNPSNPNHWAMGEDIDERLAQLVASGRTFEGAYLFSSPSPKIQRVSAILRQNPDFAKYCSPKIISFGPIHHRSENLKLGQHYKSIWASRYIEEYSKGTNNTNEASRFLHDIIQDNIGELKKLFSDDVLEGYDDRELSWMLFVDGCSLLYYMDKVDRQRPETLGIKLDQLMYTWRDITLLENQLPMIVLELLSKQKGLDLESLVSNFLTMGSAKRDGKTIVTFQNKPKPTHIILDSHRSVFVDTKDGDECNNMIPPIPDTSQFWQRYKNIRDLKTAGIRVKANPFSCQWHDISFTSGWFGGELRMPIFLFNDSSAYFIRNMIAYEMCPDFPNNFGCCSYFSFMDSLIDDAEDVKELRLAGVFENLLGSDEELAKFINEIGHDLPTKMYSYVESDAVAYSQKYVKVKLQIQNHYRNKWKWWLAEARNTYFNSPWSLVAVLAALLALVLTFIQTIYTIHPK